MAGTSRCGASGAPSADVGDGGRDTDHDAALDSRDGGALPIPTNACGGTADLVYGGRPAAPGSACGECSGGVLACGSPNLVVCLGERGTQAGCRDAADAGSANLCGGFGELRYLDRPARPGDACGSCGTGFLVCQSPSKLSCLDGASPCPPDDAGTPNPCGGRRPLTHEGGARDPGDACGACENGLLICTSPESLGCVELRACEDAGDGAPRPVPNTCGGYGPLLTESGDDSGPGDVCGPCVDGRYVCASPNLLTCLGATADGECEPPPQENACRGTGPLLYLDEPAAIGQVCGACGDGRLACTASGTLACGGATPAGYCDHPEDAPNDCGGRGPLLFRGAPSSLAVGCGPCGFGVLECATQHELACAGDASERSCPEAPSPLEVCVIPGDAYTAAAPTIPEPPSETAPTTTMVQRLPLLANSLVYDPFRRKLYASVPGTQGAEGNSIAVIDGPSAQVEEHVRVGSNPTSLALSDNGSALWVYNSGASTVSKIDLDQRRVTQSFVIGTGTPQHRDDTELAVLPGGSDSVLVTSFGAMTVFDDGVPRPRVARGMTAGIGTYSPRLAYGYDRGSTAFTLYTVCINDGGAFVARDQGTVFYGFLIEFDFAAGVIYSRFGATLDIAQNRSIGTFASGMGVEADARTRRLYSLSDPPQLLQVHDMDTLARIGTAQLGVTPAAARHLVRWGRHGFAFVGSDQYYGSTSVYVGRSELIP